MLVTNRVLSLSLARAVTRTLCTAARERGERKPLYRRLSALGRNAEKVGETMDEWLKEGQPANQFDLMAIVKQLRTYKRNDIALQLTDWMEKKGKLTFSSHAVRLDLIAKVKGIDMAEGYFFSLPEQAKNRKTYGALFNNYCQEKMVDKAIVLFKKFKKLNWASDSLIYNSIMTLYMRLGQPEKVTLYFQEMKDANITPDTSTFNIIMNSYASVNDIDSVEVVVKEMKKCAHHVVDWTTYCNLAAIYNSSGLFEKSVCVLKKAEEIMNRADQTSYHFLISLYARTGNLADVKRVWRMLKTSFQKTTNRSYLSMLNALKKLGDWDGAKQLYEEWESSYELFDVRLMNLGIQTYLTKGMRTEAELLWKKALEKHTGSDFRTLEIFANYYMERRESDLATKCLKLMTHSQKPYGWRPDRVKVNLLLKYFEEAKDVDGAEEVCKTLKKLDCLETESYELLLRIYLAAGRKDPSLHRRIMEDEIEISSEIVDLLEKVCFAD